MYQFCEAIISIFPEIPKPDHRKPFHRNIKIEGNEFHPFDYPVLFARSVENISFLNNKIYGSHLHKPWHKRKYNLTFDTCRNVEVSGNLFDRKVLGKNLLLLNTSGSQARINRSQGLAIIKRKK